MATVGRDIESVELAKSELWRRLELKILLEETLERYPNIELAGRPVPPQALFVNQVKTLPVRLTA